MRGIPHEQKISGPRNKGKGAAAGVPHAGSSREQVDSCCTAQCHPRVCAWTGVVLIWLLTSPTSP